ncbi:aromatic ring-hydroxylating dioxygenase subunit alpha [Nesterenkonia sp. HG001]|uniref:aromatic ring-hydroxylating oxygenase subunit alpha n=1 Tax=Nesterenkonia sp. HG001 TaxID=2983207 RepID=UPI002AC54CBC|nr:aromatic ring-hydroxylating dioxygenase subunit alpha [Nesterenkonia sp. HG001]MDZ5079207.1 aromatic ring-hydroxylating dioxygenase subunit alpha [Nesterenkonia sp. HG001]
MIIDHLDEPLPGSSLRSTPPGDTYTDPEIFAQEQAAIFEKMWNCVLRADSLPSAGEWKKVTIGREEIIVVRTRRSGIAAYYNVCRHRGMRVCTTDQGRSKTLQCGYHAWTYALEGELVAAPNLTSMPDVDNKAYGLRPVHVREWLGYVWVCLADIPPDFDQAVLGEVRTSFGEVESIDNYGIENLACGDTKTYDVQANWKLIIENFMECYHCATIHPELTEVIPEFAEGLASQRENGEVHGAAFGSEIDGFTVDGSSGVSELPAIAPDQERKYYAITVRPQVFINTVPDHVILHRMFPVSESRTIVECDWLFLPEVVEQIRAGSLDVSKSVELFHRVNQQDFEACEQTQPSMSSKVYASGGALVPSEHHISEFHDWWYEALGWRAPKEARDEQTTAAQASQ